MSPIIELNVGGIFFVTSKDTLCQSPYFGKQISLKDSFSEPLFLDRDPTYFRYVLNYLRDGDVPLPGDVKRLHNIKNESKFLELPNFTASIQEKIDSLEQPQVYRYRVIQLDGLSSAHIQGTLNSLAEDGFVYDPNGTFSTSKEACLLFRSITSIPKLKPEPVQQARKVPHGAPSQAKSSSIKTTRTKPSQHEPQVTTPERTASKVDAILPIKGQSRDPSVTTEVLLDNNVKSKTDIFTSGTVSYNRNDKSKWNLIKKYIINATHQRIKLEGGWMTPSTVYLPTRYQQPLVQLPTKEKDKEGRRNRAGKDVRKARAQCV
ncbi:hypothetical protein P9112_005423 [Eukaryota sp. TZLM1-RC]